MKRVIALLLTLVLVISNSTFSVLAADVTDTGIAEPANILCIFGHKEAFRHRTVNTMCVHTFDSHCQIECYVTTYCSRCNEELDSTYMHVKYDCLRNYIDDETQSYYICPESSHEF